MKSTRKRVIAGSQRQNFINLAVVIVLGICAIQVAGAQSFTVRNPKNLAWPQAEAEKIYKFGSQVVEAEFKPAQPVHPKFTLVLGYEKNQLDVNTNELRLMKWDRHMFTEGVVLFGFEQMLSNETKLRMVQRALKESNAILTADEARKSSCAPGVDCGDRLPPKH